MEEKSTVLPNLKAQGALLGAIVLLLWLIEIADRLLSLGLDGYGVRPRQLSSLDGVLYAPFLHGDFAHVAANSVPFIVLGWLLLLRGYRDWLFVTIIAIVGSGVGTWLFAGRGTVHIGASGVVFGYLGFLLIRALLERSLKAISAALIVTLMYGSLVWGVLPGVPNVSWQMHLFGFIAGIVAAWQLPKPKDEEEPLDFADHIQIAPDDWSS